MLLGSSNEHKTRARVCVRTHTHTHTYTLHLRQNHIMNSYPSSAIFEYSDCPLPQEEHFFKKKFLIARDACVRVVLSVSPATSIRKSYYIRQIAFAQHGISAFMQAFVVVVHTKIDTKICYSL